MQRRFHIEELLSFIRRVHAELRRPCTLVVTGEVALALGYSPDHAIVDIEVWSASDRVIWTAAERASEMIARPIHLRQAPVDGAGGMSFESRLRPTNIERLRFLTILVPEAHDLLLLGAAHDPAWAAAARELRRAHPLSLRTLLARYHEMKGDQSGQEARATAGLLAVVARLYGNAKAAEIERRIKGRPSTPHKRGR